MERERREEPPVQPQNRPVAVEQRRLSEERREMTPQNGQRQYGPDLRMTAKGLSKGHFRVSRGPFKDMIGCIKNPSSKDHISIEIELMKFSR